MGILDGIVGGVTRNVSSSIQSSVSNAAYKATSSVSQNVSKGVTDAVKKATINAEEAIKKISFAKNASGGYDLFYDGKPLSGISRNDLKMVEGKKKADAMWPMKAILKPKHEVFQHEKVVTTIADRMLDDIGLK
ncbi:hypothetical protein HYT84_02475 [Candidatus Micrarchaeota archaeon]|nr:hypothetical protein [Candidatus Micrarchaeota archaeon]